VSFRGFRDTSEVPGELAACDTVVVPSMQDNRGDDRRRSDGGRGGCGGQVEYGMWGRGDLVEDGVTGRGYHCGDPTELATILRQLLRTRTELASLQREGAARAAVHDPDTFTRALVRASVTIYSRD